MLLWMALLFMLGILISISLTLLWVRKKLQQYMTNTYAVKDNKGIEALEPLIVNGTEQWFHARGRDRENPLLLYIHGGPGGTHIGWYDEVQRPWENHFTVVQWDHRQAGKSYAPGLGPTISHKQYIDDVEKFTYLIRKKYNKDKVFLMGTSYGTYLGMQMVKRKPEWVHAYIGVGQVVCMAEHVVEEYRLLCDYVKGSNDKETEKAINRLPPLPCKEDLPKFYSDNAFNIMEIESRIGKSYPDSFLGLLQSINVSQWMSPHYTLKNHFYRKYGDLPAVVDPGNKFYKKFYDYDLQNEVGNDFEVPIVFLTGRNDFHVAYTLTESWFNSISAPYKKQIWFEHSAHAPFLTEPYKFSKSLIEEIRPLAFASQKDVGDYENFID